MRLPVVRTLAAVVCAAVLTWHADAPIDRAHAQPKGAPQSVGEILKKEIDALNKLYRELAEAECGARTTDIPPMQEVLALEKQIQDFVEYQARIDPEVTTAYAASVEKRKAAATAYYGKNEISAAQYKERHKAANAEYQKVLDAAIRRYSAQVQIVRKPKVQCPEPATALQPASCEDCKKIDEEIARLRQLLAETEAAGMTGMVVWVKDAIGVEQKKRAECQKTCARPPRPKDKQVKDKHATESSRRAKSPPTWKQPPATTRPPATKQPPTYFRREDPTQGG